VEDLAGLVLGLPADLPGDPVAVLRGGAAWSRWAVIWAMVWSVVWSAHAGATSDSAARTPKATTVVNLRSM
jgi:hypothetical protein